MNGPGGTHHHGPLSGLSAAAAAVLTGGALVLVAARRQLGQVATVIAWALMAAVILAVIAAAAYAALWLRCRALHPELLAGRPVIRAEVLDEAPAPQAVQAPAAQPAAIEPPREIRLQLDRLTPGQLEQLAAIVHHTEEEQ